MGAKFKGLGKLNTFLRASIRNASQESLDAVGKFSVNWIKGRTREGYDLNKERPQPPLKQSTISQRGYLSRYNRTPRFFSPDKSNLTLTGQLLNAVFYNVNTEPGKTSLVVDVKDSPRRGYKYANSRQKNPPTNQELAGYLAEMGRFFVGMDDEGIASIRQLVIRSIRRKLRELRKDFSGR